MIVAMWKRKNVNTLDTSDECYTYLRTLMEVPQEVPSIFQNAERFI
jgi:hypothetical protein